MLNVSLVVEPEKFLELFVPEPTLPAGKEAHERPPNPFTKMRKPTTERKMYEDYVSHFPITTLLQLSHSYVSQRL